jgi:hypothetical protein
MENADFRRVLWFKYGIFPIMDFSHDGVYKLGNVIPSIFMCQKYWKYGYFQLLHLTGISIGNILLCRKWQR